MDFIDIVNQMVLNFEIFADMCALRETWCHGILLNVELLTWFSLVDGFYNFIAVRRSSSGLYSQLSETEW